MSGVPHWDIVMSLAWAPPSWIPQNSKLVTHARTHAHTPTISIYHTYARIILQWCKEHIQPIDTLSLAYRKRLALFQGVFTYDWSTVRGVVRPVHPDSERTRQPGEDRPSDRRTARRDVSSCQRSQESLGNHRTHGCLKISIRSTSHATWAYTCHGHRAYSCAFSHANTLQSAK